jgi:hypothetical protein
MTANGMSCKRRVQDRAVIRAAAIQAIRALLIRALLPILAILAVAILAAAILVGNQYAYGIQGIAVSDFIAPRFYDPVATAGTRCSFGGNIEQPRQVLPGGYISFANPEADEWQQILFVGSKPTLKVLGSASGSSIRAFVDNSTRSLAQHGREPNHALDAWCAAHRQVVEAAASARAKAYTF